MFPSLQAVSTPSGSPGPTVAPPVVTAYRVDTGNAIKASSNQSTESTAIWLMHQYRDA